MALDKDSILTTTSLMLLQDESDDIALIKQMKEQGVAEGSGRCPLAGCTRLFHNQLLMGTASKVTVQWLLE